MFFKLFKIRKSRGHIYIRLHRGVINTLLVVSVVFGIWQIGYNFLVEGFSCSRYVVRESHQRVFGGVSFGLREADFACQFGGMGTEVILVKYINTKEVDQKHLFTFKSEEDINDKPYPHQWATNSQLEIPINQTMYPNLEDLEWNGLKVKYTKFK